jgi:hypothetical protein
MAAVPSLERAIAGIKTRATIDFLRDSPKKLPINVGLRQYRRAEASSADSAYRDSTRLNLRQPN